MRDLSKPKTLWEYVRLFFSGFAMGAADVVPGVSGGTMAFILGIYETLIDAIKSFNLQAVKLAVGMKFGELLNDHIPIRFLIALGMGILTAVFTLAALLEGALDSSPTLVFAFFAGLIVASIIAVGAKVKWSVGAVVALILGAVVAFVIVGMDSLGDQFGHTPPVLFVSGMIAICAMILPGISGSFILLILGQYDFVLGAVKDRDLVSIISVGLGAVLGIVIFSRILSWLLKHYENVTIAVLVGFMAGSLRLIVHRMLNAVTEVDGQQIWSSIELDGGMIAMVIVLGIIGFVLVTLIDHAQSRSNPVFRLLGRS
ncbi:MAG: DUF368 domain-containing protein [Anaerolineae bacterium]|nr:DUF368 domain-containing protein [Anaerolineae bacterium]MCA9892884.1 DUF368 domain-containing protein [Anaerolineae bacterium]MCB9461850.1 DUF368 domain-containing protein [Anaerolineaceae bacterium]